MSFYCENCKERGKWADAEIDRLRRELAEAQRDAERYRTLRASYERQPPGVFHPAFCVYMGTNQWETPKGLDAKVDQMERKP